MNDETRDVRNEVLSVEYCEHADEFHHRDHLMPEPVLLLWLTDSPEILLERYGRQWLMRPQPGCFDYYPSGLYPVVHGRRGPTLALKMAMDNDWRAKLGLAAEAFDSQPRLQFTDRRLLRLANEFLRRMDCGPHGGPRQLSRSDLQLAVLACWAERQAVSRTDPREDSLSEPMACLVRNVVDGDLTGRLPVDRLAALTGYSESQFLRRFKVTFKNSPHRYVMEQRLERAKSMLQSGNLDLTTIAHQLGFASHAHFSTAFRERTGFTPSRFRNASRE